MGDILYRKVNMANEFLIKKWKMWFSWFDLNKDGKISLNDLDTARSKYANLHHFDDEQKKRAIDIYTSWWSEYLMWGKSEITEDEFIAFQRTAFENDKENFKKRLQKNQDIVCDLLDTSRDGFITEEDYLIMFKSSGYCDESVGRRWFNAHNPVEGKVAVKVMADLWTHFLACDDSSIPDVFMQLFEAGM